MKKLFTFFLCVALVFLLTPVSHEAHAYTVTCVSGKHQMHPFGLGVCYNGTPSKPGSIDKDLVCVSKCSKCGLYVISQNYPGANTRYLGAYTMDYKPGAGINGGYVFYGGRMGVYMSLTADAFIQGFEFLMD